MSIELSLRLPDEEHVIVSFDGEDSGALPFVNPLTVKDRDDLRWYLESYGAHSLGDPDDEDARRVVEQLPVWGQALFDAVFGERAAQRLFNSFQDTEDDVRLLTISAEQPAILALPWELLHDSGQGGVFLFNETPRISIRRRVAGATGGRGAIKVESKERLHLLFVISRPRGAASSILVPTPLLCSTPWRSMRRAASRGRFCCHRRSMRWSSGWRTTRACAWTYCTSTATACSTVTAVFRRP